MKPIKVTKEQLDELSKRVDKLELSLDGFYKLKNGYGAVASKRYAIKRLFKVIE